MSEAMADQVKQDAVHMDTSDVDKWVGKRVVFAEMWDEASATEIRRWVQSLDYPNPIHWDEANLPVIRDLAALLLRRALRLRWTTGMDAIPPALATCRELT